MLKPEGLIFYLVKFHIRIDVKIPCIEINSKNKTDAKYRLFTFFSGVFYKQIV